ncbi:MAG: SDR family oxidoreductase [Ruminococcaceae bacterium]|nr:SDR family oxidoreductase [Oscillospiraceae bacterium]
MDFKNKTAIITGASVGIGRAAALLMAQKGANLILVDINYEALEKLKCELSEYSENVLIYKCDVSDENGVNNLVNDAISHFDKIDILVNNAALWRDSRPFCEVSSEDWKKFFDINVFGTVYFTKAVLPGMLENKYGRIINVASVAGVYGNANMVNYSATKGAVIAMTKALAKETTGCGVTVNAVSPGSVSPSDNPDIDYYQESALSFAGRTGTGRENAELICFLASDDSAYISGQNIQIDGCRKKM